MIGSFSKCPGLQVGWMSRTIAKEGDFEQAAQTLHDQLGEASTEKLNTMLQSYGFGEQ